MSKGNKGGGGFGPVPPGNRSDGGAGKGGGKGPSSQGPKSGGAGKQNMRRAQGK